MDCNGNCQSCALAQESPFYAKYGDFIYSEDYRHPYAGILNLTDACTNACPYCFVSFNKKEMTLKTAIQACEYLLTNALLLNKKPTVTFFGGEPLLMFDKIIVPIVEKYNGQILFNITTNGTLLTPDKVDFLKRYNIPVLLSFDGVKEVQDVARPLCSGSSSFEAIMKNIPYAVEQLGYNIVMRSTLTKQSLPYLYKNFLLANDLGFKSWSFAVNAYEEWNKDDTDKLIKELDKITHDIAIALHNGQEIVRVNTICAYFNKIREIEENPSYFIDNKLFRCGMGTTGVGIDCDGNLVPCQEKNSKYDHIIGNVFTGIDKEEHEKYLKWYMDFMQNWNCDKPCNNNVKAICLNDLCPSRMEDLGQQTPATASCAINQALHKTVSRLYLKYAYSCNPYIRNYYFADRKDMEVENGEC